MPPYNAVICIIYERIQLIIVLMIAHEFFQLLAGLVVSFWIPSTVDFIFLCAGKQSALTISLSFSLSCSYHSTIWGLRLASFFLLLHVFIFVGVWVCLPWWVCGCQRDSSWEDSLLPPWGFWSLVPIYYRIPPTPIWTFRILALFGPVIGQRLFYWFLSSGISYRQLTHMCVLIHSQLKTQWDFLKLFKALLWALLPASSSCFGLSKHPAFSPPLRSVDSPCFPFTGLIHCSSGL